MMYMQGRRKALGIRTLGGTPRLSDVPTGNGFGEVAGSRGEQFNSDEQKRWLDLVRSQAQPPDAAASALRSEAVSQPVCLVAQSGDGGLEVDPAGLRVLQSVGQAPVAVISVAGLYRTGKSYHLRNISSIQIEILTRLRFPSVFEIGPAE
jgi:hypothetical protein